jgi:hypothetical protein
MTSTLKFDRQFDEERAAGNRLFVVLVKLACKHGYLEYRGY